MKLTEEQLQVLIRESVKKVLKEYAYHEKQHEPSEEEHAAWIKKKAAAKKKYYDALKTGDGKDNGKSVDYYDYKHGDHPVMKK